MAERIFKNPMTILLSVILGILVGIFLPQFGKSLTPYGTLYLSALQMTIIPYMVCIVSISIAHLLSAKKIVTSLKKIVWTFVLIAVVISVLGICIAIIMRPGQVSEGGFSGDNLVITREIHSLDEPIESSKSEEMMKFILDSLPKNIFFSLAEGRVLQIVIFTIIFGAALGFSPQGRRDILLPIFQGLQGIFEIIIQQVIKLLPLGIFFLFSSQVALLDIENFKVLTVFLGTTILSMLIMLLLASVIIWWRSGLPYWRSFLLMRVPLFIAASTSNSVVCMPAAIGALSTRFNQDIIKLVVPIGISICRYGNIAYFSIIPIFVAQVYHVPLSFSDYGIIILGSVFAGITTTGASGIATLPMLGIILDPMGLPISAIMVLLIAVDPFVDVLRTLLTVYVNSAAAALVSPPFSQEQIKSSSPHEGPESSLSSEATVPLH